MTHQKCLYVLCVLQANDLSVVVIFVPEMSFHAVSDVVAAAATPAGFQNCTNMAGIQAPSTNCQQAGYQI